jgi:integrase
MGDSIPEIVGYRVLFGGRVHNVEIPNEPVGGDNTPLSKVTNEACNGSTLQLTARAQNAPKALQELLHASISDNTRRAYRSDIAHFFAWGGSIPTQPEVVASYLAEWAGRLSVASLSRRVASISRAHTSQGLKSPTRSDLVTGTLRGIRCTYGVAQHQVTPILREDLLAMVSGLSGTKGIRDRALLLLGFAGAFRRSEVVSLNVEHLGFVDRGLLVTLTRSKTDQEGEGRKLAIPFARGSICPVRATKDWLQYAGITEGPVFRCVNRREDISRARLSSSAVALVVKQRVHQIGLDPTKYSGHSLRAGLITSAARLGVSVWKIKAQSGHRSEAMVSRYVRDEDLFNNNAAGAVL